MIFALCLGIAVTIPDFKSLQTNPGNPNVKQPGSGTAQQIKQILRKDSFLKSCVFI